MSVVFPLPAIPITIATIGLRAVGGAGGGGVDDGPAESAIFDEHVRWTIRF
jgi:hypothetical protein